LIAAGTISGYAQERFITVASTTSTEQSGLFGHLLPRFEQKTGIKVHVVAVGTGQALDLARRGDADVVFVHARSAEEKFLAEGHGVKRYPVMYNDFVLLGPKSDPAKIAGGRIFWRRSRNWTLQEHLSSPAATRVAPISRSSICGKRPASTSTR